MSKLMVIRRDDRCADCGESLPGGVKAYWDASAKVVRCVECGSPDTRAAQVTAALPHPTLPVAPKPAPPDLPSDVAGASARREYEKRAARELAKKQQRVEEDAEWRRSIKEERPVLGRIAAALTPAPQIGPESQPTKAWKVGSEGEERVAEVLAGVAGIEVLHDRRVPGTKANIDHIAVGPRGVFVIDAKKYTGAVEVRNVGGLFRPDERLYVNGRDRSKLVEGVLGQIEVVRTALGDEYADVPVRGVLCFIGCEWGWIMKQKCVKGVTALWPKALAAHVTAADERTIGVPAIAEHLRTRLRPA